MIGAPVPGVVNALQVTIPGRSPSVPSVKALGNATDEKKKPEFLGATFQDFFQFKGISFWSFSAQEAIDSVWPIYISQNVASHFPRNLL